MRILVVEPDTAVAQSMRLMLQSESFNVTVVSSGAEAVEYASLYDYDLMTLELNLSDVSGLFLIQQLRAAKNRISILVCSGLPAQPQDIARALHVGADDYMTKPFHKDELVARIHAIVRRSKGHAVSVIETGPLSLNISNKIATVFGKPVKLTPKEFTMLELLSLRKGHTLTKVAFLLHLYDGRDEPDIKIIDVFVCKLRGKLKRAGADGMIETVWGRGYTLRDPGAVAPSLQPELRDMMDSQRGVGYGIRREALMTETIALERSPSVVPGAGRVA